MTDSVDPKEYQHLLYENRKFKGRVENYKSRVRYCFYILKNVPHEAQRPIDGKRYHVALLDTGELVCVNLGYTYQPLTGDKEVYIGTGVVHHDEYW
jgi:hypothetical protein